MIDLSFSSLRTRLVLIVVIATAPLVFIRLLSGWEDRQRSVAAVEQCALHVAKATADDEDRLFEGAHQFLSAVARLPQIQHTDVAGCQALLGELLARPGRYANLGLADASGNILCAIAPSAQPLNVADRKYFRSAVENRTLAVGLAEFSRGLGSPTLTFGYPVLDGAGGVQRVLFVDLDLAWFNQAVLAGEALLLPGATITIIDHRGVVMARYPAPESRSGRVARSPFPIQTKLSGESGLFERRDADGASRVYAFASLTSSLHHDAARVVVDIPARIAFAQADHRFIRNLGWVAIIVLTAFAGGLACDVVLIRQTRRLTAAARRVATGDFSIPVELPSGAGELGTIGDAFTGMTQALDERERLRVEAQKALQVSAGRLAACLRRSLEIQENERRSVGREVHDELGQALTGLKLRLEMAARSCTSPVRTELDAAQHIVADLVSRVRELCLRLRPTMLDDLGLLPTLLWHVERYQASTKVHVAFGHEGIDQRRFASEVETAVYRIVQEALTNVARHAEVHEAAVSVRAGNETIQIIVEDRGRGFDPQRTHTAAATGGLSGMRERAVLLGGRFLIESRPHEGTHLLAELPLDVAPSGECPA